MLDYTIVILATVILAFEMVMSKVYQKSEGTSICAGLTYNVILGLACAVISFVIGGFQIRFSWFSVGVAAGVSVLHSQLPDSEKRQYGFVFHVFNERRYAAAVSFRGDLFG